MQNYESILKETNSVENWEKEQDNNKEDWTNIHEAFAKKPRWSVKTNQQQWEEDGLTCQEAQQWISTGLTPWNNKNAKLWKDLGFTFQDAQPWIKVGLKPHENEFIFYLKNNVFTPQKYASFTEKDAQKWVDYFYPLEKRKGIKKLEIIEKGLTGTLQLSDFVDLKELHCYKNKLTSLDLSDCEELISINCQWNQLTNLFLPKLGKKLKELYSHNNYLTDLTIFSHLENCKYLYLSYNPFFGSLEPLGNLAKLKRLDVKNTEIDSGLEYLPASLKTIFCNNTQLAEILKPHNGNYRILKRDYLTKLLIEERAKIENLEDDIIHLTNLTNEQRKKIIAAYLKFAPEKELLRELIISCLDYYKARKKRLPAVELRRKFNKIHEELELKVGEELVEEIETILTECDELMSLEIELESEITKRKKLIEDYQERIFNITLNVKKIEAKEGSFINLGNINVTGERNLITMGGTHFKIEELEEDQFNFLFDQTSTNTKVIEKNLSEEKKRLENDFQQLKGYIQQSTI